MPLLGYSDRLSATAGTTISFFVSTDESGGDYNAQLIRLSGVDQDASPIAAREHAIVCTANGHYAGRHQPLRTGSHLRIPTPGAPDTTGLAVSMWYMPTKVGGTRQVLCDLQLYGEAGHLVIAISADGCLQLECVDAGGENRVLPWLTPPTAGQWVYLQAEVADGRMRLSVHPDTAGEAADPVWTTRSITWRSAVRLETVTFAATATGDVNANGRIENPALHASIVDLHNGTTPIAAWDFAQDISTDTVTDTGPQGWHGTLINRPTRAILGHRWDRSSVRFTDAPAQWNAIHFHDDDLDDAGWAVDFTFTVPDATPSGVYAFKLTQGSAVEYLPFYVSPAKPTAKVLFIAPTNTYTAYASEHLWEGERGDAHAKLMSSPIQLDRAEELLQGVPGLGRSLYDTHSDGSGVMYATTRRPMVNMRPNYVNWLSAGRRHFSADLFIIGWLEHLEILFDVMTEEDIDARGTHALAPYDLVITGSHPEYPTVTEYEAFESYVGNGGKVMYLGANGFYWVTSYTGEDRTGIEVRRGYTATRNWTSHPAELHHSSTGELGGTWRHRGYNSNAVFGVGMAAIGWAGASAYRRSMESRDPGIAWVFAGTEGEVIGSEGYVLGGAAGDELDNADATRGTPPYTTVLMSSSHNALYYPAIEVRSEIGPGLDGANNPDVRGDVVLVEHPGGGSVFSVGSICWAGALAWNKYDNDVARVTANVLNRFLESRTAVRDPIVERSRDLRT
jgi:N,N-dimethylformamidase